MYIRMPVYCIILISRNSTICHLVHPLVTVLDDSIGCALWFASRGHGVLYPSNQPYQSTARVCMDTYMRKLYDIGLSTFTGLDWTTGFSLKPGAYHYTITCDLFE